MLKQEEYDSKISHFISTNVEGFDKKRKELERFRTEAQKMREYHLALSEFTKAKDDISLEYFQNTYNNTIDRFMDFNPYSVDENVEEIYSTIGRLIKNKENLIQITTQLSQIKGRWTNFIEKNTQFENSKFNVNFEKLYQEVLTKMNEVNVANISSIEFLIESLDDKVTKNIGFISKLVEYRDYYMYQGESFKEIKHKLDLFLDIEPDKSEGDYTEEGKAMTALLERSISESTTDVLGVPVIVAKNKVDTDIKRYTLKFGKFIIKSDPFFLSKGVEFLNTKEYFYIGGVPKNGIFKGKEIIENLRVYDDYTVSMNEFIDASSKNFYILIGIFFIFGFVSLGISNIIVSLLFLLSVVGGYFLFSYHLNALKTNIEEKYKIKNIFLYRALDMVIYQKGYDVDTEELLDWSIQNLDSTIYNSENINHEDMVWLEK